MERINPSALPNDYRLGIYTPFKDMETVCTVDTVISQREILMHDETNDKAFTISPHTLKTKYKRVSTKKGDGWDVVRLFEKKVCELGGLGYELC